VVPTLARNYCQCGNITALSVDTERSRSALGHGVSENACGDGLAGAAMSSQESVKQEILNASLRITVALAR
jgi:hypothetical protein